MHVYMHVYVQVHGCVCVCVRFMMCPNLPRTNSDADDPYQVYPQFLLP